MKLIHVNVVAGCGALALALASSSASAGGTNPGGRPAPGNGRPRRMSDLRYADRPDWSAQPWIGDERPYQTLRATLDRSARSNRLTEAMIEGYRLDHENAPQDPQKLYRWAYSTRLAKLAKPPVKVGGLPTGTAFEEVRNPRCYEFDRMRFIVAATSTDDQLEKLARRLMRKQADDFDVMYGFLFVANPCRSPQAKAESLRIAKRLATLKPASAAPYSMLGGVYYRCWLAKREVQDARDAIAAYTTYVERTEPGAGWRPMAERVIERLRKEAGL